MGQISGHSGVPTPFDSRHAEIKQKKQDGVPNFAMDLTDFSIPDIYGVERVPLNGTYTESLLAEILIAEWIPYFECHKCGRWDYCKYAKRHPANPNRSIDIKCGVACDCLRNLVKSAFPFLVEMNRDHIQEFLDGAFDFYRFIYDAEQYIGMNMDEGFHKFFGEYAPAVYSRIGHLRNYLNGIATHWKDLPAFLTKSPVLFVEGYAEKTFLDELRKSHSTWFLDLNVEVYEGKGNRRSKRIQMLLKKFKAQGLVIYAQGDADGESADIFRSLIDSGSIDKDKTFVFEHDFETSLPKSLLLAALIEMQFLPQMPVEDFAKQLGSFKGSVNARLKEVLDIDVKPHKIELATTAAALLNEITWWPDKKFMTETELGRFLRFIQGII